MSAPARSYRCTARKAFKRTGVEVERLEVIGSPTESHWRFGYGLLAGSSTFSTLADLKDRVLPWIARERKRLVAQAAELEQVERYITRLTEEH